MKKTMTADPMKMGGVMKKGGKVKSGMHKMPDGSMMKNSKMKMGGELKTPTEDQKGLKALPTPVRNKMGFKKNGGAMKKAMMGTDMYASPMMKMGGKMAKQAAVAIAMKKDGKAPKKSMQYGGKAASMVPMKKGGTMSKKK